MKVRLLLLTLVMTTCLPRPVAADRPPPASWAAGTVWRLTVERHIPGEQSEPAYTLRAVVAGKEQAGGRDCWKISFIPDKDAPFRHRVHALVDPTLGWVVGLARSDSPKKAPAPVTAATVVGLATVPPHPCMAAAPIYYRPPAARPAAVAGAVVRAGDAHVLAATIEGFPLELFPLANGRGGGKFDARFRRAEKGDEITAELEVTEGGRPVYSVRQTWVKGELWWREYERHVNGRKELTARLANAPGPEAAGGKFSLRADPRLRRVLHRLPATPSLPDLLARLRQATGLRFDVSEELSGHTPDLGYLQPSDRGYYCWQVMEIIQASQLEGGRWEKLEQGYRLSGRSVAAAAARPGTAAEDATVPPGSTSVLVWTGVGLAALLLFVLGLRGTQWFRWLGQAAGDGKPRPGSRQEMPAGRPRGK
jgi:hypothetical protein